MCNGVRVAKNNCTGISIVWCDQVKGNHEHECVHTRTHTHAQIIIAFTNLNVGEILKHIWVLFFFLTNWNTVALSLNINGGKDDQKPIVTYKKAT